MSNICLKTLFVKNFRSIDNHGLTIEFDKQGCTTLVGSSENGAGKSTTWIHALYYALFDKAYSKDALKSSLVNTRNNKDCLVELSLTINGVSYKIRRGMKPTIFDIIKEGKRLEDEAALKDYQNHLISILGFDERTACNTFILGKDKFKSFINMSLTDRRSYGETVLGLCIFSKMNEISKDELKTKKLELVDITHKLNINETNIFNKNEMCKYISNQIIQNESDIKDQIINYNSEIERLSELLKENVQKIELLRSELTDINFKLSALDQQKELLRVANLSLQEAERSINHYNSLHKCDNCSQTISEELRYDLSKSYIEKRDKINKIIEELSDKLKLYNEYRELKSELDLKAHSLYLEKSQIDTEINFNLKSRDKLIVNSNTKYLKEQLQEELLEYKSLLSNKKDLEFNLTKVDKDIFELNIILEMLKDDGIKSSIIRQYIPYLNSKINEILNIMNIFINIEVQEDFELKMNSPDRKGQTLASLSTGQQARVDLACILAWREVASLKSSIDINVVILDEILENLSEQGIPDFMNMWYDRQTNEHLIVISQRFQEFKEYFNQIVYYKLVDDFTVDNSNEFS